MTDQEKRELSLRIATLADAAGLPIDRLWKATTEPMIFCEAKQYSRWAPAHKDPPVMVVDRNTYRCGVISEDGRSVCNAEIDPLLVQLDARDFTDPTYLLPLVEAWLAKDGAREWTVKFSDGEWVAYARDLPHYPDEGRDPDRTMAEALALAAALEAEKGEKSDAW